MSTSGVSSVSLNQQLQQYFQTRNSDLKQLGTALSSGNLSEAQTAFNAINTLGQSGPFKGGNPFYSSHREQDFGAIGQALQSGDLAGAQAAYAALEKTGRSHGPILVDQSAGTSSPQTSSSAAGTSPSSSAGPEIILNLSNGSGTSGTSPEQITINIGPASTSGGGEQVSLSVGNQGSNSQQVTFNLSPNSNEQIVLNLLNESATSGGSGSATAGASAGSSSGGSISVSA